MRLFRIFSRSPFLCAVGNHVPFLALGLCVYLSFFLAYLKFINSIDLFKELTFGFVDFPPNVYLFCFIDVYSHRDYSLASGCFGPNLLFFRFCSLEALTVILRPFFCYI